MPFYLPLQEISRPTISPYIAPAAPKILDSLVFYDQKMQISISDALAMALKPKHDKNYYNLSALEKSKKQFLLNAAKVIYMENSENLIPNSILIAIAVHESAWAPCVRVVVRCSIFLYFSGGRDRTMTWDIHRNENQLC